MHLEKPHPIPLHEREFHHEPTHADILREIENIKEILRRIEEK